MSLLRIQLPWCAASEHRGVVIIKGLLGGQEVRLLRHRGLLRLPGLLFQHGFTGFRAMRYRFWASA